MPDRRQDLDGRSRIVALESRYQKVARHLTLGIASLTLGVVLALALVWQLALDNRDQGNQLRDVLRGQQANRVALTEDSCTARNREHRVMRDLLVRSLASTRKLKDEGTINAEQLRRAEREYQIAVASFPVEPDCAAYARRLVNP